MTRFNTPGRYVTITTTERPSIYANAYGINGQPALGVGNIQYNTQTQKCEVYNGSAWISIEDDWATIKLSSDAEMTLDWARTKMNEEREIQLLATQSASVKAALDNLNKAKQQLAVTVILSKEDSI